MTQEELDAELCRIHNRDRWPQARVALSDGPLRRELVRAGYLQTVQASPNSRRRVWVLTAAARERLVNYPGSGIVRQAPAP